MKGTVAVSCQISEEAICRNQTCLHDCCPIAQFRNEKGQCTPYFDPDASWEVRFYDDPEAEYHKLSNRLDCEYITYNLSSLEWKLNSKGHLSIESHQYYSEEFCLNYVEAIDFETSTSRFWKEAQVCLEATLRQGKYMSWYNVVELKLLPAIFGISMGFLGLLVLYIWSKKKEKLFECMMISCVSMLFIVYLILTIDKIVASLSISKSR